MRVPVERLTPSLAYSSPPIVHDVRHGRQRLDVVDDGRLRVQALRSRGTAAGCAACRARPRGSRAARSPRRRCTRPRRGARRCRGRSRSRGCSCRGSPCAYASAIACVEPLVAERELAAQVDEREVALRPRTTAIDDALDELVRIALDEHAVLERRRLALVAVDHEVARERVRRQERPLLRRSGSRRRRGRAGPTASPAPARRPGRPWRAPRAARSYAPRRERAVDRPRVVGTLVQPLRDDPGLGRVGQRRSGNGRSRDRARAGARAGLVLLDDRLGAAPASAARGTRSSPAAPARRRTRRGTRPLRR